MPSIWNQTLLFSYCRGKQGPAYETETKTLTSPQQTEIFLKNLSQSTAFYHTDYDSYCPIHKQQIQMEKKNVHSFNENKTESKTIQAKANKLYLKTARKWA